MAMFTMYLFRPWMVKRLSSVTTTRRSTRTPSIYKKLVLSGRRLAFASYGRVAGMDGGLCAHVFAALRVLSDGCRNQGPATNSICIASMPCSWGHSKQDVEPKPVMDVIVDRSTMVKKGPPISYNLHDSRTRELQGVEKRGIASLDMPFPVSCIKKGILMLNTLCMPNMYGLVPRGSPLSYQRGNSVGEEAAAPVIVTLQQNSAFPLCRFLRMMIFQPMACAGVQCRTPMPWKDVQLGILPSSEWLAPHRFLMASNFRRIARCQNGHDKLLTSIFDVLSLANVLAIMPSKIHEAGAITKYKTAK